MVASEERTRLADKGRTETLRLRSLQERSAREYDRLYDTLDFDSIRIAHTKIAITSLLIVDCIDTMRSIAARLDTLDQSNGG